MREISWLLLLALMLTGCDNADHGDEGTGDEMSGDESPGEEDPPNEDPPPPDGEPVPLSEDHRVLAVFTSDNDVDDLRDLFVAARSGRMKNLSHPYTHVTMFAVSPDNRWVAFATGTGLHVTPIHEADAVEVTPAGNFEILELAWKPDSTQVALRARLDGGPQKGYVVNSDGTGFTDIGGPVGEVITRLLWSGDLLAFHSDQAVAGQHEVYVWNGTSAQRISFVTAPPGTPRFVRFSWSPTASCLSFLAESELYVWDGTNTTLVSDAPGIVGDSWVWNGDEIVYPRDGALYVVSKTGGDARKISGDVTAGEFSVSPNGVLVAFLVDNKQLYVTDGVNPPVLVAEASGLIRGFKWSAIGSGLAYRATDVDPPPLLPVLSLYAVDASGATPPELVDDGNVLEFAWVAVSPQLASARFDDEELLSILRDGRHRVDGERTVQLPDEKFNDGAIFDLNLAQGFGPPTIATVTEDFLGAINIPIVPFRIQFFGPPGAMGPQFELGFGIEGIRLVDGPDLPLLTDEDLAKFGIFDGKLSGFGMREGIAFERRFGIVTDEGAGKCAVVQHDDRGQGFTSPSSGPKVNATTFETRELNGDGGYRVVVSPEDGNETQCFEDMSDQSSGFDTKMTPTRIRGVAQAGRAVLRTKPFTEAPAFTGNDQLRGGERVTIIGRSIDSELWLLVERGDGQEGWIFGEARDIDGIKDVVQIRLPGILNPDCLPQFADDITLTPPK